MAQGDPAVDEHGIGIRAAVADGGIHGFQNLSCVWPRPGGTRLCRTSSAYHREGSTPEVPPADCSTTLRTL